ncbi:YdeI/OmpD-associated family protein, partial [Quadrisphaera sp. KR29]|uniref:YdeI/OmpD-associated family protein n=1 Tax=Quadrisphaera sp. KR29 TaxID=3461391 RepID=UPI004044FEE9
MAAGDHLQHVEVTSAEALRAWLGEHHAQREGVWLVTWKKHVADRYVPHEAVLDELVAVGWTDGPRRRIDADTTRQLVSPRRTPVWARSYRVRAERLEREGRMHPAGRAAREAARARGAGGARP